MLDVIRLGQVPHILIYEWGTIVADQSLEDPKACNDVRMKFATAALVAFFKGTAFTHFVKYSMAAKVHIWPLEGGFMGPIRSSS